MERKKYFAEYIPQEEVKDKNVNFRLCSNEIKVGDKVKYKRGLATGFEVVDINEASDSIWLKREEGNCVFSLHNYIPANPVIIGEISPEATWIKQWMEFNEDEIEYIYAAEVRKEYRNGEDKTLIFLKDKISDAFVQDKAEYWAEHISNSGHRYGYTLHWGDAFLHHINIKGPCGYFH